MKIKILFLFMVCCALCESISAQVKTKKGSSFIGGGVCVSFSDSEKVEEGYSKHHKINLRPSYAYFIRDNFAIGGGVILGVSKQRMYYPSNESFAEESYSSLSNNKIKGVEVFAKKIIPVYKHKIGVIVQPTLEYVESVYVNKSEHPMPYTDGAYPNELWKNSIVNEDLSVEVRLGLYYFLTEHFSVEINLMNVEWLRNKNEEVNIIDRKEGYVEKYGVDDINTVSDKNVTNDFDFNSLGGISFDKLIVMNCYF
ncbi:hypothetical protein V6R21_08510 [Limibacter armeniacum]|uniref:hypothetical protein n=1 Tax=Limibacter armeniacum TaxID=466084 RepID=UPI002FE661B0